MARINTYPFDTNVIGADKVVGTDAVTGKTKNFALDAVRTWLNTSGGIGIVGQNTYRFQTDGTAPADREAGTISLLNLGGNSTAFSDVTQLIFSATTAAGVTVTDYLTTLLGQRVILASLNNPNSFGVFSFNGYTLSATEAGFYVATLGYLEGNGSLSSNTYYGLATYAASGGGDVNRLTIGTDPEVGITDELQSVFDGVGQESRLRLSKNTLEIANTAVVRAGNNPMMRLIADDADNPSSNEIMGTMRWTRNFEDPLALDLARAIYGDFAERVAADGGTVEGSEECVASELELIVAGEYLINMGEIRTVYTGQLGSTKADMVFYVNNGGTPLEKFRITTDGDIEVKDPSAGVILHSQNNTPYRIVVGNTGAIEAIPPTSTIPVITTLPTISGLVNVPETITASAGSVTSLPTFTTTFQWQVSDNGTSGWSNVSGATATTFELTTFYGEKYMRVVQTATNILGSAISTSLSTIQVQPWTQIAALKTRLGIFENEAYASGVLTELDNITI